MRVKSGSSEEGAYSFRGRGHGRSYTCTLGFRDVVGLLTITQDGRQGCAKINGFKIVILYLGFRY